MPGKSYDNQHLKEVALLFLKLGCIGFGGPAVHIAMMEEEVVQRRKWMSAQHFLDFMGATNLIPGPNSTELAMHCGKARAGWGGFWMAGLCFIIPAVIITGLIAWVYDIYGHLPAAAPFLDGIRPAVIVIIIVAAWRLGKKAVTGSFQLFLVCMAFIAATTGVNEILVLFATGLVSILSVRAGRKPGNLAGIIPFFLLQGIARPDYGNWNIFLGFLKIGSLLYGSGYVLFAFLDAELVSRGLLTPVQLADAIAVGQFTPGPVFSSATFIGWQLGGVSGAAAATAGIFLPAFAFVALLGPVIPYLCRSRVMAAFLDGVNTASVALILSVAAQLVQVSMSDWGSFVIAVAAFIAVLRFRINAAFIIGGGALAGYLLRLAA